jgi:5-methyltetrahydropteroyltriglutamate--homocysteine methyltransferase
MITSNIDPPFRAEHIGSLLRPTYLLEAREHFANGRINGQTLREAEDRAIRDAVELQQRVGLKAVTDGELRRATYVDFVATGLTGVRIVRTDKGVPYVI